MFRLIVWIICIYILAKIVGIVLQSARPFFDPPRKSQPTVREKKLDSSLTTCRMQISKTLPTRSDLLTMPSFNAAS